MSEHPAVLVGVGAVVFRGEKVLLIRRAKPPLAGAWSIPGGALDYGETLHEAVRREVREETGVEIRILDLIDVFEALPREGGEEAARRHMLLVDFVAEWRAGEPVPGDDAAEAQFVPVAEALKRLSWDKTREAVARAIAIRRKASKTL
ncbi:NUDIX hydrolase [Amphiplicatus metriothermophilus]|uniref:ADP-ribose pyrophosphatase YjhB, NUDIX family n=1 Tax=Amphiplicatus metriothermophilus TaxID=1519374 RepID=A0A239PSQ3_9PROT|nr:NUDIX hydrolase [Amphiplicatus metriothermophilus]MBB5519098.1 8-oxo-dGTP diphosphatase [Amphiplicatus metriothermophilus]SNT73168.1 ADP-ribose pyrophosphatase YjhB, NUDIX family [Amphiplicatus metriothermophilus]